MEEDGNIIGVNVKTMPRDTWRNFRAIALMKGYRTSDLLIKVIEEYISRHADQARGIREPKGV